MLEKESRASDTAKLFVTGRDTPYQELTLCFRDCNWEMVKRQIQEQLAAAEVPPVLFRVVSFMQGRQGWSGTATELLEVMGESGELSTVITKWLNEYRSTFLYENGIQYDYRRKYSGRKIILARCGGEHDSHDGYDGSFGMPPHAGIDTGNAANLQDECQSGQEQGKNNETKLKQAKKRYDEVTRLFDRLYEDSLSGRYLPIAEFYHKAD